MARISDAFRQLMDNFSEAVGEKIDEWDGGPIGDKLEPKELLFEVVMLTVGPAKCLEWAIGWGHGSGEELHDQLVTEFKWSHEQAEKLCEMLNKI